MVELRILAVGDPHFKENNAATTTVMTQGIVELVAAHTPDLIVVLGDILHDHEHGIASVFQRACQFLSRLCALKPVVLLIGNHDLANNQVDLSQPVTCQCGSTACICAAEAHFFGALKRWANLTVVDRPQLLTIKGRTLGLTPYLPPGRLHEYVQAHPTWQELDLVFAHQTIAGCKHGAIYPDDGDEWLTNWPVLISGHIHEAQRVGTNVYYCGTPVQHTFGDDRNKAVSLLELGPERPSNFDQLTHTRHRLPGLTSKVTLQWTSVDLERGLYPTLAPDTQYRLIIKGPEAGIKAIRNYPVVKQWRDQGVKVILRTTPTQGVTTTAEPTTAETTETTQLNYRHELRNRVNDSQPALNSLLDQIITELG